MNTRDAQTQVACLNFTLRQVEGALLRVLGTIERRSFQVTEVHVTPQPGVPFWDVSLKICGIRDVNVLCRQIERLVDVVTAVNYTD